jgi:transposase
MDGSKDNPRMTAGLDIGDRYSYLCLIDQHSGEVIEEGRLRTSPEAFRRRFVSERPCASPSSPAPTLRGRAGYLRSVVTRYWWPMPANCGSSTPEQAKDRRDRCLKNLARLARVDPKLLYPLKHRGEDSQAHMAIIRSREALVARTQLVNHVRRAVKSFGARLPKCEGQKLPQQSA